ncbi:MAG: hypothetical protein CMI00_01165 [Oceanospirillaceae bacterium]|nr:hypothetical protein [Oceanospirillaceae bacterium]|tara:strand:+ start:993 stop:1784 length:792 start_codon:yes stop_codon:yes gene_type:complete
MTDSWWLLPLLAGVLLAMSAGPLGSFVVWKRMAFFGDTLAHGALLGITFGVMTDLDPTLALVAGSLVLAVLLLPLQRTSGLATDTLLGIVSHGTLAVGLVLLSLTGDIRVDLNAYLFGDLLAIDQWHVLWLLLSTTLTLVLLRVFWTDLLAVTVSPELARIEGRPVAALELLLTILLACTVALAMKVVGILLISAMLIIPAATARAFARTPGQMTLLAAASGVLAVLLGVMASFRWDTPAGPSIVVSALLLFLLSLPRRSAAQ